MECRIPSRDSFSKEGRLLAIREACTHFINGPFLERFAGTVTDSMARANMPAERYRVERDAGDPDGQTLLFWYPTVSSRPGDYIRSAVKIEAGAKSALDPNEPTTVRPYVADDLPGLDLRVTNITTVEPRRTFWDKVVILHGLRRWHDRRGYLRQDGQRASRHYYDVFRLLRSPIGEKAVADRALAVDCARHARMFFHSPDLDLDRAVPGTLALVPTAEMLEALERDYEAMAGMVMGNAPALDEILSAISTLERRLNC